MAPPATAVVADAANAKQDGKAEKNNKEKTKAKAKASVAAKPPPPAAAPVAARSTDPNAPVTIDTFVAPADGDLDDFFTQGEPGTGGAAGAKKGDGAPSGGIGGFFRRK